jgi:hypothetical protein
MRHETCCAVCRTSRSFQTNVEVGEYLAGSACQGSNWMSSVCCFIYSDTPQNIAQLFNKFQIAPLQSDSMLNICQAVKGFTKLVQQTPCGATLNIKSKVHSCIIHFSCVQLSGQLQYPSVRSGCGSSSDIHMSSSLTLEMILGTSVSLSLSLCIYVRINLPVYMSIYSETWTRHPHGGVLKKEDK